MHIRPNPHAQKLAWGSVSLFVKGFTSNLRFNLQERGQM
ncbi:hypothetical protein DBT_0740 [Dissulfuribacter thermophilus]|uniref:Uncharacterized protein n=1 Tax=Dissulfuribacter thermophilus TaxID=1156395 RepID=A0A1B9F7N4_9BACT|nr:hypothetical protein DBT_0740 [Dissulfuribacter thermophilus]